MRHGVPCDFEHPEVVREFHAAQVAQASASGVTGLLPATALNGPGSSSSAVPLSMPLYPQPGPILPGSQPLGRATELRLMHQYTKFTYKTLSFMSPEIADLYGISVPEIAFQGSPHLVDALLAVAALHLRSANPSDKELVRASHAYMISCVNSYSSTLASGITALNAEPLFLTSTLIAFQSTASRTFTKDESSFTHTPAALPFGMEGSQNVYQPPMAWFHAFQGVKTVVAASWPLLKQSNVILSIIDAQPVLNLNFTRASEGFFGHLLDGVEEEIAALAAPTADGMSPPMGTSSRGPTADLVMSTRQAYQHAVATLNWAHAKPGQSALAFPATVSKRFVELLEERQPRALATLACFFALLKIFDQVWWLQGMARREVMGIVSLFNSDYFGPDVERKWWPHLEWAVRVALYDTGASGNHFIPADVWGPAFNFDEDGEPNGPMKYTNHIDMLAGLTNPAQSLPPTPAIT